MTISVPFRQMLVFLAICGLLSWGASHAAPIAGAAASQPQASTHTATANPPNALSDAEKNNSTQMNAADVEAAQTHKGGLKIVFIGNSITLHGASQKIGWLHEWGMAASAAEKDFVHIVTRGLEQRSGRKADVRVRNLARFERNFATYDYDLDKDLIAFAPDYLIVALGENVAHLATQEERLAYYAAFKRLLEGFLKARPGMKAIVRGVFWPSPWKDELMARAASELSIPFVKADIATDESMMALGLFEHKGVQRHPGDKGMAEIARIILAGLQEAAGK